MPLVRLPDSFTFGSLRSRSAAAFCAVLTLCGCGDAAGSGASAAAVPNAATAPALPAVKPSVTNPPPVSKGAVPVHFAYLLPATTASQNPSPVLPAQSTALRRTLGTSNYTGYTSPTAAITINLTVTPVGGAAAPYSGTCTTAPSGTSGTCAITFTAAPGPTTFAGTLTESGSVIARFSQVEIIAPGSANAINFTANPVVSTISLSLAAASVNAGVPSQTALVVNAMDANGNIIAGNAPYTDSTGKPVAFTLTTTNAQAGGAGTVVITGPPRITAPGQAVINAQYDGRWLQSAQINISSTSSLIVPASTTLNITPTFYSYPTPDGALTNFITAGPDGNLWATECGVAGTPNLLVLNPNGTYVATYAITGGSNCVSGITVGPDGNLWFADGYNYLVGRMTPTGGLLTWPTTYSPDKIVTGPDGNLWFTVAGNAGNMVANITTSGTITYFASGGGNAGSGAIAKGPDGRLWFVDEQRHKIGVTTIGGAIKEYAITGAAVPWSEGMVTGPDGNLWSVDEPNSNVIVNNTAGVKLASISLAPGQYPQDMTVGPDGNIWTADNSINISQVNAATKTLMNTFGPGGGSNGSGYSGITLGPDGNLWVCDQGGTDILKFVY